jgi:nitroimidazol reductase NimA-like FMN-containing flavoprotein (pyridoxamine 5'-phosphate oxidase superfamily)
MSSEVDKAADRYRIDVLDEPECLGLLRTSSVGRIAVVTASGPEIFPVNFIVDHGTIVFRTAEGTKLSSIATERNVAFEVDGFDPRAGVAWSVVAKGDAQQARTMQERFDAADLTLFPWQTAPKPFFVRIRPRQITGRRFRVTDHVDVPPPRRAAPE